MPNQPKFEKPLFIVTKSTKVFKTHANMCKIKLNLKNPDHIIAKSTKISNTVVYDTKINPNLGNLLI